MNAEFSLKNRFSSRTEAISSFSPAKRVPTDQFVPSNLENLSPYRAGILQNLGRNFMEVTNY